ncbi:MAG: site-2 protease family protein [Deltaproteobacteria bacterium]
MKWSWKLGEFAGIGVYMHATFILIIAWVVLIHWRQGHGLSTIISAIIFVLAIFLCVVLHEFGHALTAKRYGIKTRDITLLPIGGVARLERMPDDPMQEFWVALAGPAVTLVIAALLYLWLQLTSGLVPLDELTVTEGSFAERLMLVNIFLLVFNLIPAFPMDGGRVLRALLALRGDYVRATQTAAVIGQGIALIFGFIGLFTNPFLIFIALFVWIGAAQEASMIKIRSALGGIPVSRAMLTDYKTVSPGDTLKRLADLTMAGSQQDFPVVEGGRVTGIVSHGDLIKGLSEKGHTATAGEIMRREFQVVDPSEMLEMAFGRLQAGDLFTMPVVRNGMLVGLLTMDNVGEFMRIQGAVSGSGTRGKS